MLHIAGNINNIAADRACSRQTACTEAQEHCLTYSVTVDEYSVINAVYACQRMGKRNHRRVNTQADTVFRIVLSNRQKLYCVTEVSCIFDIAGFNAFNAFNLYIVQIEASIEGDRCQNSNFTRSIQTADIGSRIGLCIALGLRFLQYLVIIKVFVSHLGQHIVGGAVHDTHDRGNLIGCHTGFQRSDDRNTAADAGLKHKVAVVLMCQREQLGAEFGQNVLVGSNNMLAVGKGSGDKFLGRMLAAQQLNDNINILILKHLIGVVGKNIFITVFLFQAVYMAVKHLGDSYRLAYLFGYFFCIFL